MCRGDSEVGGIPIREGYLKKASKESGWRPLGLEPLLNAPDWWRHILA